MVIFEIANCATICLHPMAKFLSLFIPLGVLNKLLQVTAQYMTRRGFYYNTNM